MNIFFDNLFGKKSKTKGEVEIVTSSENKDIDTQSGKAEKWSVAYIEDLTSPIVAGSNYLTLFSTIPEVFFPIDYIASRIAGANFQLKKTKDDSIVWANKRMNGILSRPNCLMRWKELIYQHHIYKLCTGNSFIRAAMPDVFSTAEKWRYCDNYWVLPSDKTIVEPVYGNIPLFGIAQTEDIIRSYRLEYGWNGSLEIPPYQIWHDRDGSAEFYSGAMFLKSKSRLASQNKPMSNLIAVYEARNVIYVKRGGLGFIVSKKTDATGSIALTDDEKEQLLKQNFEKYGVRKGQVPYGISDADIDFVRTNLSIAELQPFEETLADAINIAGAYGIPAVLVPRKDQSTFSNQATAEKSVYCSTVIPMAKQFCKDFTAFLGLEGGGYYLDCDFSDVDCLQEGLKESEDVKTNINKRCREQFSCGLITLNDWRAQIGESMIENPLFDKLKFDMSDEELDKVNRVLTLKVEMKKMEEKIKSLQYKTKANDVDEKGIVTVAVNGIGVKDSQNDISMPGSFNKTLKENIGRMRWFLNHRTDQLLGVPLSGKETEGNLVMVGQLNLEKQIGRDTLADYKLFAENGRTLEHSIGVKAIKRDSIDPCKVLEWRMMEYSTLTSWGSNPQTFLVNIKSATADQVKEAVDFVRKAFLQHGYSDERLKGYDMELSLLLKSLNGGAVVSCPHCGYQFDYDAETEHTFAQQVLDYAADYQRWITQDIVREEMEKLTPEIRTQVISLIDSVKSEKKEFTQKGLQDLMNYVRCPHCWGKVYRSNAILQNTSENTTGKNEPSVDTQEKNDGENGNDEVTIKAADNGTLLDFKSLNSCFENK